MLFNSLQYLFFFPLVAGLYFILPYKFRPVLLLIASFYFYMAWKPAYILLMLACIGISYISARLTEKTDNPKRKKATMICGACLDLSLLLFFKYLNFLNDMIGDIFALAGISYGVPDFSILLPMGISFYTFQSLSYIIDVYRGDIKAEKNFWIYALYISFFPQLVAGPIERSGRLLPQFREKHDFNYGLACNGLKLIAWGLFKKLVIADRISPIVDNVYADVSSQSGPALTLATVLFAVQIYCDFSGYSDIAIGSAKFMGYDLMRNFSQPYFSKSIREFWQRWHISLSQWFRDYVYIPLGGNRCSKPKWCFNIMVTFIVSGLWHGANLTYVIWGALHGAYQIIGKLTAEFRKKIRTALGIEKIPKLKALLSTVTVFVLVCFAWIFFRANSISDAVTIVKLLPHGWLNGAFDSFKTVMGETREVVILALSCAVLFMVDYIAKRKPFIESLNKKPAFVKWTCYLALIASILCLNYAETSSFIYFQF